MTMIKTVENVEIENNTCHQMKILTVDDKHTLVLGDCMDALKAMKDCSVDVTFTSPPYNDSGKTDRDVETKRHIKYELVESREDWLNWQIDVIDQLLRVTKKYVLYNVQAILSNREDVYRLIGHFADKIHQILIWYKPNAQPQPYKNRIGNSYEMVLILRGQKFKNLHINSDHYSNVIVQNINADHRYSDVHRAVMPLPFADEIIREFTQSGDVVLDPFMGLGTTGVSCIRQGRLFTGVEIYEPYYKMAYERLAREASQVSLFDTFDDISDADMQHSLFEGEDHD